MSSEDPIRSVPDEMFRQVSAKPERELPDALFGPAPAARPSARAEDVDRKVPDELFRKATAKPDRPLPDALFGPAPVPAEPDEPDASDDEAEDTAVPENSTVAADTTATAVDTADAAILANSAADAASVDAAATAGSEGLSTAGGVEPAAKVEAAFGVAGDAVATADVVGAVNSDDVDAPTEHNSTSSIVAGVSASDTGVSAVAADTVPGVKTTAEVSSAVDFTASTDSASTAVADAVLTEGASTDSAGTPSVNSESTPGSGTISSADSPIDGTSTDSDDSRSPARASTGGSESTSTATDTIAPVADAPENASDSNVAEPDAASANVAPGAANPTDIDGASTANATAVSTSDDATVAPDVEPQPTVAESKRPVLLVIADSLAYFGPEGGLAADHPQIWPNLVGAELDWDIELVARIGWTCRDGYWALIGDPRVWAAVPHASAVVFAVGGMDTLPSPLPTAMRETIRYVRPPGLRRVVRGTYNWLQPKLAKIGRRVALPPRVSVNYLEQSREALAQLRPELPVIAVLPSVHNCVAYGRVHRGRARAVRALQQWSARTSVPLVDLGEAVRDNVFSDEGNPDGIHWGWAGHTAVANAMVKTLQEVR